MGATSAEREANAQRVLAIANIYDGSPKERADATDEVVRDLLDHTDDYMPKAFVFPKKREIEPMFGMTEDQLRFAIEAPGNVFGLYRLAVLDYEASLTKQLEALVWTLSALDRRADTVEPADLKRVHCAQEKVMTALIKHWGVGDNFLKVSKDRRWSSEYVRRYDLLPLAWRYL